MIVRIDNMAIADKMVKNGWNEHEVAKMSGVNSATIVKILNKGSANFNTARDVLVAVGLDPQKHMEVPTSSYFPRQVLDLDAIETIMEENGDTYQSVADRMGCSKQAVWQSAHYKRPRSKTLKKLAKALGVEVEQILKGEQI